MVIQLSQRNPLEDHLLAHQLVKLFMILPSKVESHTLLHILKLSHKEVFNINHSCWNLIMAKKLIQEKFKTLE